MKNLCILITSLLLVSGCNPRIRTIIHTTKSGKQFEVTQIRNGAALLHPHQGMILVEQKNLDGTIATFDTTGQSGSSIEQLWGPGASVVASAVRRPSETNVVQRAEADLDNRAYGGDSYAEGGDAEAQIERGAVDIDLESRSSSSSSKDRRRHH